MGSYLLDTNVFYNYLMICKDINLNKIKPNTLVDKEKFKNVLLSENAKIFVCPITITETASRFSENPEIIKKIMHSIVGLVSIVHKPFGFCIEQDLISELATPTTSIERVKKITCQFAEKRYNYESYFLGILLQYIGSAVAFYLLFDEEVRDRTLEKDANFLFDNTLFQLFQLLPTILKIKNFTIEYVKEIKECVGCGSLNKDQAKKSFNQKVLEVSIVVIDFIECEVNKLLVENDSILNAADILDLSIKKKIDQKKSDIMKYLVKLFKKNFSGSNSSIAYYTIELLIKEMCEKCSNPLYEKYMKVLCEKWFIIGKKLDKNDFFDSVYMMYIENELIPICFEQRMIDFLDVNSVKNLNLKSFRGDTI